MKTQIECRYGLDRCTIEKEENKLGNTVVGEDTNRMKIMVRQKYLCKERRKINCNTHKWK